MKSIQQKDFDKLIEAALENRSFRLYLQPQYNAFTGIVSDIELLVRWIDLDGRVLTPAVFFPFLHASSQREKFNKWVMLEAFQIASELNEIGFTGNVAFNFDVDALMNYGIEIFTDCMASYPGLTNIEVEITEHPHFFCHFDVRRQLERFKEIGAKIVIDDFGTGMNNLEVLDIYPFDKFKLDRRFMIHSSAMARRVLAVAVDISKTIKKPLVVEGVESAIQLCFLQKHGVEFVQGYHFAKPSDKRTILQLIGLSGATNAKQVL